MDQEEGLKQDLQNIGSQLSEEEKEGSYGRMLSHVKDIAEGGWSFRLAQKNLGELQALNQHLEKVEIMLAENVEKLADSGKKAILQTLEYQKRNCTDEMVKHYRDKLDFSLEEYYEDIANDKIIEHEKTKKLIIDGMRSYLQEKTDKLMKSMVNSSAYVAVVQLLKIYFAWKKISNASNVIEDKNLFTSIYRNLEEMENKVAELLELCEGTPIDHRRISLKMALINTIFNATLGFISSLRVNIDGHLQRLDIQADDSAVDGVVNAQTATSQAYQLWYSWENLSSYVKWLGSASVALFSGLAFGNYRAYKLSKEVLKDLRKKMREVVDLQDRLQLLHQQALQAISVIQPQH
ncbi:uncharacterized protein LOC114958463 [Acropora millepora]|uniref:uncharacterized protein LOC114958463 n=1 Tax=Acropora millepora TaxID=45264 RepID=UPI001CF13110|nr:uncharacterized protein LOC114958463 [Acropora millepora]